MLQKCSQNAEERCRTIAVHLRQGDAIAAIAHIYTAMRSLHMHTCTHTHTHTNTAIQSLFFLAVSTHTYSAIYNRCRSTQTYTAKRSLQRLNRWSIISAKAHEPPSTQIFYINVFPMRHCLSSLVETRLCLSSFVETRLCLSSLVETRLCLSPLVETRHCLSSSIKIACTIPSQPTNCTIIISSESKPASKKLHTWANNSEENYFFETYMC